MVNENVGRLMAERVVSIGARSTKRRISEDDGRMRMCAERRVALLLEGAECHVEVHLRPMQNVFFVLCFSPFASHQHHIHRLVVL